MSLEVENIAVGSWPRTAGYGSERGKATLGRVNLTIAAWDTSDSGGKWIDLVNGGTTGDTANGSIGSDGAVAVYTYFTLASKDLFDCVPCKADAGEDKFVLMGLLTQIGKEEDTGLSYIWTPAYSLNDDSIGNPFARPHISTEYTLNVTNSHACVATDEVKVEVIKPTPLYGCTGGSSH